VPVALLGSWMTQQSIVLDPSDPNQVDSETIQIHAGIILSAIRNYVDIKREGKHYHDVFKSDMEYDADVDIHSNVEEEEEDTEFGDTEFGDREENGEAEAEEANVGEDTFDIAEYEVVEDDASMEENAIYNGDNLDADIMPEQRATNEYTDQSDTALNTDNVLGTPAELIDFIIA